MRYSLVLAALTASAIATPYVNIEVADNEVEVDRHRRNGRNNHNHRGRSRGWLASLWPGNDEVGEDRCHGSRHCGDRRRHRQDAEPKNLIDDIFGSDYECVIQARSGQDERQGAKECCSDIGGQRVGRGRCVVRDSAMNPREDWRTCALEQKGASFADCYYREQREVDDELNNHRSRQRLSDNDLQEERHRRRNRSRRRNEDDEDQDDDYDDNDEEEERRRRRHRNRSHRRHDEDDDDRDEDEEEGRRRRRHRFDDDSDDEFDVERRRRNGRHSRNGHRYGRHNQLVLGNNDKDGRVEQYECRVDIDDEQREREIVRECCQINQVQGRLTRNDERCAVRQDQNADSFEECARQQGVQQNQVQCQQRRRGNEL